MDCGKEDERVLAGYKRIQGLQKLVKYKVLRIDEIPQLWNVMRAI
jgi:lipopolysaccharide/colanic/teichoic acid biosynthesis glycosyltransferase